MNVVFWESLVQIVFWGRWTHFVQPEVFNDAQKKSLLQVF